MEVINNPDIDAVWICSPSQFHAEQIKAAAANKKHVFCEKPIATDLGQTVEAINACNEAGVKLMIGLQRRFDDNFRRVRDAIEDHEVGDTIMVRIWNQHADEKEKFLYMFSHAPYSFRSRRSSYVPVILHRHRLPMSKEAVVSLQIWRSMIWICLVFLLDPTLWIFLPLDRATLTRKLNPWRDLRPLILRRALCDTPTVCKP